MSQQSRPPSRFVATTNRGTSQWAFSAACALSLAAVAPADLTTSSQVRSGPNTASQRALPESPRFGFATSTRGSGHVGGQRPEGGIAGALCGSLNVTQNVDPLTITPANTATCADQGLITVENGHARQFIASESFRLDCVRFGVQENFGGAWAVEVLVHQGAVTTPYSDLVLLDSTAVEIPNNTVGELFVATFPDGGPTIQEGTAFIIELKVRSRRQADGGDGGSLYLGSNNAGETAPTYLRAPDCGLDGFFDLGALGFPQTDILIAIGGDPVDPVIGCGSPAAGSCFIPHSTPGCNNQECCQLLCALLDPTCCTVAWDISCVELAYSFGECTFQQAPCPNVGAFECRAGCRDNFAAPSDPASPSSDLVAALTGCQTINSFDVPQTDACFAHTFTGCWPSCGPECPQPGCGTIVGAMLEVRMRSLGTISSNDTISFWDDGTALAGVTVGVAAGNPSWPAGATATLVFNFGPNPIPGTIHVPPSSGVLASLCDGELGLVMQDDTMMDYANLVVFVCPCDNQSLIGINRDAPDGFSGPTATTPSAALLAKAVCGSGALQQYDVQALDQCFVDTISGLPPCMSGATITMGVRPDSLWWTDGLAFEVIDECGVSFRWSRSLPYLNSLGLFSPPLASGQLSTITLDLDNLPPSASGVTSVLSEMFDGSLDVYLQDDTGVDFIRLDILSCTGCDGQGPIGACCLPPEVPGGSWHCADLTEAQCEFNGGTWLGPTVNCSQVDCTGPCVTPPWGMVAWHPLEPTTGQISDDLTVYQNHGVYGPLQTGGPLSGPGVVGGAHCFDGIDDEIAIPPAPSLDFGCSPFSIDMWVNWEMSSTPAFVSLVGQWAGAGGWVFGIDETTGQLEMLSESQCLRCIAFSGGVITPNTWTHIAVVLSGCPCGDDCENDPFRVVDFYIDGTLVGSGTACCNLTSQTGPASTIIGGSSWFAQPFKGCLDEIEIFNRPLLNSEIYDIWNAGSAGKCKDRCHASWDRLVCTNVDMAWAADITICNDSGTPRTYSWTVTPSAACPISGVTYSPNSGTVTVGAKSCITIPISVDASGASGLGSSCFDLNVLNLSNGQTCTHMGMVYVDDCVVIATPCDPWVELPTTNPGIIGFDIGNIALPPTFQIQIDTYPSDMVSTSDLISLNGGPGGEPWARFVDVPQGNTKLITVSAQFLAGDSFRFYDAVLSIDIDGDGDLEAISSLQLRQGPNPAPCVGDLTGDGVVDGADLATLLGAWGPGAVVGDLTGDGVVDGADLATLLGAWGPCP
jgi:Concanavalin A-like lectin/glucanases superfamily